MKPKYPMCARPRAIEDAAFELRQYKSTAKQMATYTATSFAMHARNIERCPYCPINFDRCQTETNKTNPDQAGAV
ncbi:MAG: hypothetical protein IPN94_13170 [Sphingobacteriales bacterium]|nr:hypothetical protein [Sphingobacteriales bacterium]